MVSDMLMVPISRTFVMVNLFSLSLQFLDTPHAHLLHLLQPPKKGVCVQGHVQTLRAGGVSTANILDHFGTSLAVLVI